MADLQRLSKERDRAYRKLEALAQAHADRDDALQRSAASCQKLRQRLQEQHSRGTLLLEDANQRVIEYREQAEAAQRAATYSRDAALKERRALRKLEAECARLRAARADAQRERDSANAREAATMARASRLSRELQRANHAVAAATSRAIDAEKRASGLAGTVDRLQRDAATALEERARATERARASARADALSEGDARGALLLVELAACETELAAQEAELCDWQQRAVLASAVSARLEERRSKIREMRGLEPEWTCM